MLLSSWLKKLVQRTRSRTADGKLKKKVSPFTQLGLTRLEDRVVLTVNPVVAGTTLQISLTDLDDSATVQVVNAGADIRVDDGTTQQDFTLGNMAGEVNAVELVGSVDANQSVTFQGDFSVLPNGISTDAAGTLETLSFTGDVSGIISDATFSGTFDITVGTLNLGGDVVTQNATIGLDAAVTLMTNAVLDTTDSGMSNGAAITLTGSVDNDASTRNLALDAGSAGLVTVDATIGASGPLGALSITADDVALNNTIAANTVTLAPGGSSAVGVGTDIGGAFNVSDAELDQITATTSVTIGGTNATAITMNGVTDPAGIPLLVLDADAAGGTFVSSGADSAVNALSVTSNGTSTIQSAITVDAGALSIETASSIISVQDTLTASNGNDITLDSGSASVNLATAATPTDPIVSSNGGTLTFNTLRVQGDGVIDSPGGTLNLIPVGATQSIALNSGFRIPVGIRPNPTSPIGNIGRGFGLIVIGRSDGEHSIFFDSVTFNDPVVLRAPVGAGSATFRDGFNRGYAIRGVGDASITIDAISTTIEKNVHAPNGLTLGQTTTLSSASTVLSSSGGNIVAGSVDAAHLIVTPSGGDVQFNGTSTHNVTSLTVNPATNVSFDAPFNSSSSIVVDNATGTVTFNDAIQAATLSVTADDVDVGPAAMINVGGDVTLRPNDDTDTIGLGTGTGTFTPGNLSGFQNASRLIVGRQTTGSGAVDIEGIDISGATTELQIYGGSIAVTDLNGGTNTVRLVAQTGAITDGDALLATDVTAGTLTLSAQSGIGGSGVNDAIEINSTTVSAVSTPSGGIFLNSTGTGGVAVTANAAGDVELFSSTETVTLTSITTTNGDVDAVLTMQNLIAQNANAGGNGNIRLETVTSGDITVDDINAAGNRVTVHAAGDLIDANLTTASIMADELRVSASTGIGSAGNPFETQVSRLEADGNSGGVFVAATGALEIGLGTGDADDIVGVQSTGDNIVIQASSPLTVSEDVVNSGGGNITLTAVNDGGSDDHLTIDARVLASGGAGSITLNAGTDLIINDPTPLVADDIHNDGNGVINATANRDILIGSDVDVVADDNAITFIAGRHLQVGTDSTIDANGVSGAIDVTVTGNVTLATAAAISAASTATIRNASSTTFSSNASLTTADHLITLETDNLALDTSGSPATISSGLARTIIRPDTAGRTVVVGTAPAGSLALSDAELARIEAGILELGSASTGAVTVAASITPAAVDTLHVRTNSSVDTVGGAGITVSGLAVEASGPVTLTGTNDVDTLAVVTTSAGGITFNDDDGLSLSAVDGVSGLVTSQGTIVVNAVSDGISTGVLAVDRAVSAGAGGSITLAAMGGSGIAGVASLQVNADVTSVLSGEIQLDGEGVAVATDIDVSTSAGGITVDADGGTLTLEDNAGPNTRSRLISASGPVTIAADSIEIENNDPTGAKQIIAGGSSSIVIAPSTAGVTIGLGGAVGTLSLDDSEIAALSTGGTVSIGSLMAGGIAVDTADFSTVTATTDVVLLTNDDIQDAGAGLHLVADQLALDAATEIGSGFGTLTPTPFDTSVNVLAARTRSPGDIVLTEADGVTVSSFAGVTGITATAPGNVQLTSLGGTLRVNEDITAASIDIDAGAVIIGSNANIVGGGNGTTITIDADSLTFPLASGSYSVAQSGTGTITLTVSGAVVLDSFALQAGTGNITITTGTVSAANGLSGTQEIQTSGDLSITAAGIGSSGKIHITSSVPSDGTLTLINTSTTGQGVDLELQSTHFSIVDITLFDAESDVAIDVPGNDVIRVTGSSTESSLRVDLDENSVDLVFEQLESGADVLIASAAVVTGGALVVRSEDDIEIGSTATGVAIDATGGVFDVSLHADTDGDGAGALLTTGASIDLAGGDLSLVAGSGVGTLGTVFRINGLTDFAAETETGGVFLRNSGGTTANATSVSTARGGVVSTINGVAVSTTGDIDIRNSAGNFSADQDITTANGTITLRVDGETTLTGGATVDSTNGVITLNTDDLTIAPTATINSGSARTVIRPFTGGGTVAVDIGTDAAGTLGLTDPELDQITADVLELGSTASGVVTISAMVDFNPVMIDTLRIISGAAVTQSGGPLTVQNLAVTAADGVSLNDAGNNFDQFSASVTNPGAISMSDSDDVTLGAVDGVSGLQTANGTINVTSDGELTVSQSILSGTNRDISLLAEDIVLTASVSSGSGNIMIGPSQAVGATVGVGVSNQTFTLDNTELDLVSTTGTLTIGGTNATAIIVDGVTDPANIANVVLDATRNTASVTFENTASRFNQLTVKADDGVFIRTNLTIDGFLLIDGDADDAADTSDAVTIGNGASDVTVSAAGVLTIDATTAGVNLDGSDSSTTTLTSTGDAILTLGAMMSTPANPNLVLNSEGGIAATSINTGTGNVSLNVDTDGDTAAATLTSGSLTGGNVTLDGGDEDDDTATLNGSVNASGAFTVTDFANLDISGSSGITATGDVSIAINGGFDVETDIRSTTGGITVAALDSLAATDHLAIAAGVTVMANSGSVTLQAGDNVTAAANASVSAGAGVTVTAGFGDVDTLGSISLADTSTVSSTGGDTLDFDARDSIALSALSTTGEVQITTTHGAITDNGDDAADIMAGRIALRAVNGIGDQANALDTAEATVSGGVTISALTESGDIAVVNTGGLTVDMVNGLSGVNINDSPSNNNSGSDHIILTANSPLTVSTDVTNSDGGNITLTAGGATATDDLTLNANITATGGNGAVALNAGDDILQTSGTVSAAGSGSITYTAATGTADGVLTMSNNTQANADSGTISLSSAGNVTLGSLETNNATTSAITVTSTAGAILDGGDTPAFDITTTSAAARAVLTAATGIGTGNALDTNIASLDASVTGAGNLQVSDTDALTLFDVDTDDGSITITAGGQLTATDVDSAGTNDGTNGITLTTLSGDILVGVINAGTNNDVTLNSAGSVLDNNADSNNITADALAVSAANAVGSSGDALDTTVASVEVSAASGGVFLIEANDLTVGGASGTLSGINATSDVTVTLTTGMLTTTEAISSGGAVDLTAADDVTFNAAVQGATGLTVNGGSDGTGSLVQNAGGTLMTTAAGADIALTTGTTSGNMTFAANITSADDLTLSAFGGGTVTQTAGTITADLELQGSFDATLDSATNDFGTIGADLSPGQILLTDTNDVIIGSVGSAVGITTGGSNVRVNASGTITVSDDVTTAPGTGGTLTLNGSVVVAATLTASGGDLTLNGNNAGGDDDLIINAAVTADDDLTFEASRDIQLNAAVSSGRTVRLTADRDIIVNGRVESTGGPLGVILQADDDGDASGGTRVTTAGQVVSADSIVIRGANLFATGGGAAPFDAIEVQDDGTNAQILAVGEITLESRVSDTNNSAVIINGLVQSTGSGNSAVVASEADITLGANGDIVADGNVLFFADVDGDGTGGVTMADGAVVQSDNGNIGIESSQDVLLAGLNAAGQIHVESSEGSIVDNGNADTDLVGTIAILDASTGIGDDGDALESMLSQFVARTDSGDIHLINTGALTVTSVDPDGSGIIAGVEIIDSGNTNPPDDNITITTLSPLTLSSNVTNNAGGNVTLTATDAAGAGDDLTIGDGVSVSATGGNGNITLRAGDDAVFTGTAAVSAANAGAVTVTSNFGAADALGAISMDDAATVVSASGQLDFDATQNITLGALTTSSSVTIDSTTGEIIDGGDTRIEVTAETLTITAPGGVGVSAGSGADSDIETTVTQLNVNTSGGNGSQFIDETNGLSSLNLNAGVSGGNIDLDAGGAVTDADGNVDITAADFRATIAGALTVDTTLDSMTLNTTATGDVDIDETDTLNLTSILTSDGAITVDASGQITATLVDSSNMDNDNNDVALTTTVGDIRIDVINAGTMNDVTLTSAAAITDISTGEAANVIADQLALRAVTGIGNAATDEADLDLAVTTLAATTATGDVSLSDDGTLDIATVDGLGGVSITIGGAGDDILIREDTTTDGDFDITDAVSNTGAGHVTLFAGGNSVGDEMDIRADITSGGGNVRIVSFADIDFNGAPTVSTSGTGTINVHAGRVFNFGAGLTLGNASADIFDAGSYSIETTEGDITLTATGNIDLDAVTADSDAAGAAGTVIVTADSDVDGTGSIDDALAGEAPNITGAAAVLRAAEGIGSGAADDDIDTSIATVAASNSTSGDIQIDNGAGTDLSIGTVDGLPGVTNTGGTILVNNLNGTLSVDQSVMTAAGTGGTLTLSGAVTVNAAVSASQFDVTLNGNNNGDDDIVINNTVTSAGTLQLTTSQDIVVNATIQTTDSGADIVATADSDADSAGGVQVTAGGQVNAADAVVLAGSDLVADAGGIESVQVDSDGGAAQVLAGGDITIGPGPDAPATADVEINGAVTSTGAATTMTITANQDILFGADGDVTRNDAGASGLISVFSDQASLASTGGVITMTNGTVINGGGGQIEVVADGRLTLGQIITTDLINVGSGAADIVDGGDTGGPDLIANNLAIAGETGVGTDVDSIETQVSTLSGRTNSGDFHVTNSGALTIGTVNLTANVQALLVMATASGVEISNGAPSDNLTITASSPLTVLADIANNGGGNISLTATNDGGADDHLTISANVSATGGNGSIDFNAGTDLIVDNDAIVSAVGTGALSGDADRAIDISDTNTALQTVSGDITLTANAGGHSGSFAGITIDDASVSTTSGAISLTGNGGDTGDNNHGVVLSNSASLTSAAGAAAVSINGTAGAGASSDGARIVDSSITTSDASISISGTSATSDGVVISNTLLLTTSDAADLTIDGTTTGTGVGSDGVTIGTNSTLTTVGNDAAISVTGTSSGDDGISLSVSSISTSGMAAGISLSGSTTGTGGDSSDGVDIAGATTSITSASGAVTVSGTASGGSAGDGVEIAAGITQAVDATGSATITITGTGDSSESAVQVDSPISSGTGSITIRSEDGGSTNDDIRFGAAGDITSATGTVTIDADNGGDTADVFMSDGAVIDAGSGLIDIDADVDVTLGGLVTTTEVQIDAITGQIIDGGDANNDITAVTAQLLAELGIGDADNALSALETVADSTATSLTLAAETVEGDINVTNSGHLIVGTVNGTAGVTITAADGVDNVDAINLTASSPLTVNNAVANDDGGDITLTATNDTGADDHLTISADVTASGGNGAIDLNAGTDLIVNNDAMVSAGGTGAVTGDADRA
ncbi:MAG: beta strand repeat-containing protein, partial [Planctomycetota bacterium]